MELSCCFQIGTKKGMVVIAKDGRPKSGRIWKTKQTCRSSAKLRRGVLSHLSLSFEEKEKIREEKKYVKELEKQMKEEKRQQIEELKQRRLENAKRRAENEFKSTVYQVVSYFNYLLTYLIN